MRKIVLFILLTLSCAPTSGVYTRNNDFSWLKPFIVISEVLTVDHWEKEPKFMRMDSAGVVIANGNYNPVTISQYALACFEKYRNSDDESYRKKFIANAKWLMDEKNYVKIDNDRIGYPYKFQFRDLKPGWYSGLSQAEVISVLIRYYYLTRDESVLSLIRKVNNQMLHPIHDGGLIDTTPEKMIWIEEYPGSKQHKHVLNGYLVSLFGLYEYTKLFPDDKYASSMLEKGYESLKKSVSYYEAASNNLTYDRGSRQAVNNWYMKAQVLEMKKLYEISGDEFFKDCSMLWSTYTFNKPLNYVGCKLNNWNLSVPLRPQINGWHQAIPTLDVLNISTDQRSATSSATIKGMEVQKSFDSNFHTYLQFNTSDSVAEQPFVQYQFKESKLIEGLILFAGTDSIRSDIRTIEYKVTFSGSWKKAGISKMDLLDKNKYVFLKETINASILRIEFEKPVKGKLLTLSEIHIGKWGKELEPLNVHYTSEAFQVKTEKFRIEFTLKPASGYRIFYKSARTAALLNTTPWNPHHMIVNSATVITKANDYYQFVLVLENNQVVSMKDFTVINL